MGLIEALLALALVVVVPLALQLHPGARSYPQPVVVGAGVLAALSLPIGTGSPDALATVPWVLLCGGLAAAAGLRWLTRERTLDTIVWPAALVYLTVGAVWLLLDRLDVEPVGVTRPFVLLTAVHFHYAGFAATLLAALVRVRTARTAPRLSGAMIVAVVVAPPIVAAGFTFVGALQVVGAIILTAGLFAWSWLILRHVTGSVDDRLARVLLVVSAIAVIAPMVLAVQWAIGWNYNTPALSIPAMARTHGVANAVGFALCGVCGWRRLG